ncbi:MAG: SUMF1/EgtB/PvdO family nonheme iron enzyme [Chloroflexi bacterium]|nr:SUMF1/EgtB/PvdO family nonheme iron enzyme [Chloroflexota bacterium]
MDLPDIEICEIPAGQYPLGDEALLASRPEHTVHLKAYAVARTAVTNAQYAAFLAADGYNNPAYWTEMGWRWRRGKSNERPVFWDDRRFNAPDQPVVGVSWYEALAFTVWLASVAGLPWRLPTEAEWEAAARGVEGRAPLPRVYNTAERGVGRPWPVTKPSNESWCGAADLCGNVWEWCSTRWGRNWQTMEYGYPYNAGDGREDLQGSYARVMRGGSWFDPLSEANPANRGRYLPGSRGSNIGFRLARSII